MSMIILLAALGLAVADEKPNTPTVPANAEDPTTPIETKVESVETVTNIPMITASKATDLLHVMADDLSRGEIEAVLRKMTDEIHVITADGLTYKGKKELRKALNTAMAGNLIRIGSKLKVEHLRPQQGFTLAFGQAIDTIEIKDKKPLVINTLFSVSILEQNGAFLIDSIHHSADIRDNGLLNQQKEIFAYVAAAVAGGSVILGFILGLGL